ncbi:hypothetical protein [Candidatus Mesenet endosymbiont of Agriotes lineatus]|uniref:hypothetical protein n=1 Tax=Candidatus Mesenet endosymbiont of Agriotes lineatus TaxID=3077948 RepID=UPI0030CAA257
MLDRVYIDIDNALRKKGNNVTLSELKVDSLDEKKLKYDDHYFSELFFYALNGNNKRVIELFIAERENISDIKDKYSSSLLHNAVTADRKEVIQLLIKKKQMLILLIMLLKHHYIMLQKKAAKISCDC